MADIVIGASPHIDRPFGWKTYYVTPEGLSGVVDVLVDIFPPGTVFLDAKAAVVKLSSEVGTLAVDIEMGAVGSTPPGSDTTVLAGGADWGGTLGNVESAASDGNLTLVNTLSLTGAAGTSVALNMEITYGGTETAPPTIAVSVLCGRNEY